MPVSKFVEYGLLNTGLFFAHSETSIRPLSFGKRKRTTSICSHLDRTSWVNKGFFLCRTLNNNNISSFYNEFRNPLAPQVVVLIEAGQDNQQKEKKEHAVKTADKK